MSWKLALTWVAAVVATTFLTWQIVNVAESRVGAEPVTASPAAPTTEGPVEGTSTTSTLPTATTSSTSTTSSTVGSSPSTTSTVGTTPTTAPVEWSLRTINSSGGTVVVRYRPGVVELQATTPSPGFDAEVEEAGPEIVKVEFEGEDTEVKVEVRWDKGTLKVEIDDD